MSTPHTYTSSIEYINNLSFDYIETYSFQRGAEYEKKLQLDEAEYNQLKVKRYLSKAEGIRFSELRALLGYTQYLLNEKGALHPSCKKTNTFQQGDPMVERLKNILKTEIRDIPNWLCAPTYRDAVVFYKNPGDIVSVLNVCLSCQFIETAKFNHIHAGYETYDLLKRFFLDIGHEVED
jgi:hypothetical protein